MHLQFINSIESLSHNQRTRSIKYKKLQINEYTSPRKYKQFQVHSNALGESIDTLTREPKATRLEKATRHFNDGRTFNAPVPCYF